jgi:cytochrome c553
MNKKLLIVVIVAVVVVLAALAFPMSNLLADRTPDPALLAQFDDPEAQQMVHLYATKCTDCHSATGDRPFYATLPVASSLIAEHVEEAMERFDLHREMFDPQVGITEAALAKVQRETAEGAMPPLSYTAMHWNARWTPDGGDAASSQ